MTAQILENIQQEVDEEDWSNIPYDELYDDCDEYKVNYANYCQYDENAIRLQKQIDEYECALEEQATYEALYGFKMTDRPNW